MNPDELSTEACEELRNLVRPMIGVHIDILQLPTVILKAFEPSQIGTIVGTLMDACIPQLPVIWPDNELLKGLGLEKHEGILGEREGYPDFKHSSGRRLELKLVYVDPVGVEMKKPPTPREPSARLTQKVTVRNVDASTDALLVLAYQLRPGKTRVDVWSPTIIDLAVFPMIECIRARDHRLSEAGGIWFGDFQTPTVPSKEGRRKEEAGLKLDKSRYGRKESEKMDYNEDTNFGKLKRIPYEPLQRFLKCVGADYSSRGTYPDPWTIDDSDRVDDLEPFEHES